MIFLLPLLMVRWSKFAILICSSTQIRNCSTSIKLKKLLKHSRPDFMIGVSPKREKSFEGFPWIIAIIFVASRYFSAFVEEIGRRNARGLSDWVQQVHAKHESKAGEEIRWQLITPLDIGDISIKLKIAVGAEQMSEFSWDAQKVH